MRRMPGVQAHLILGAVQPGPDGPVSVTAAEGSRVTSEVMAIPASWDITLEWAAVERVTGIEPALSAWESERNRPSSRLNCQLVQPVVAALRRT